MVSSPPSNTPPSIAASEPGPSWVLATGSMSALRQLCATYQYQSRYSARHSGSNHFWFKSFGAGGAGTSACGSTPSWKCSHMLSTMPLWFHQSM